MSEHFTLVDALQLKDGWVDNSYLEKNCRPINICHIFVHFLLFFAVYFGMANLDSVLITLNTKLNLETNAAIQSSQFDSVGRNGHLLAAPPTVNTAI